METLAAFCRFEALFLPLAFFLVVTYQLLTQQINTEGMLCDKDTKEFDPTRLQLLLLTLFGALSYLLPLLGNPKQLPEPSPELLALVGGSNVLYLGAKGYPLLSFLGKRDS